MKKIIGIILAVLMVFSMSTMAFATVSGERAEEYVMTISTGTPKKVDGSINHRYPIYVTFTNESEGVYRLLEDFEFNFSWGLTEDAPEIKFADAAIHSFTVNENVYVEPGESCKAYFYIEVPSDGKDVVFKVNIDGTIAGDYHFVDYVAFGSFEETSTTAPETTTETTTAAPTEITTTTTTTVPAVDEETGGYDEPDEPSDEYEAPEVDYEIPNTGSSKAIGGVVALGVIAAGALLLVRKRKSNEDQIA